MTRKPVALVSKCWLGIPCRYHGRPVASPAKIARLSERYRIVPVCPEELAGLPVPRPAAPLRNKRGNTLCDVCGRDVSAEFRAGADAACDVAAKHGATRAYLVKGSPSCDKTGFAGEALLARGVAVVNL